MSDDLFVQTRTIRPMEILSLFSVWIITKVRVYFNKDIFHIPWSDPASIIYSNPLRNMRRCLHWYGYSVNILAFRRLPWPGVRLKHQRFMWVPTWVAVNRLASSWGGRHAHISWPHGRVLSDIHYVNHHLHIPTNVEYIIYIFCMWFWLLFSHFAYSTDICSVWRADIS